MTLARSSLAKAKTRVSGVLLEHLSYDAHQAAERAIKAVMLARGIEFPFTHDLAQLLAMLQEEGESVPASVRRAAILTPYAMEARYPRWDEPVTEEQYRNAVEVSVAVVEWAEAIPAVMRGERGRPISDTPAQPTTRSNRTSRREAEEIEGSTVDPDVLDDLIRRVVEVTQPEKIIIFGSAVHGRMGPHSDIDVLVVKVEGDALDLMGEIYLNLRGFGKAVDAVVASPDDLERYRDSYGTVIREALREGRVVYEAGLRVGSGGAH